MADCSSWRGVISKELKDFGRKRLDGLDRKRPTRNWKDRKSDPSKSDKSPIYERVRMPQNWGSGHIRDGCTDIHLGKAKDNYGDYLLYTYTYASVLV